MSERRRVLLLIAIMTAVAVIVGLVWFLLLFQTALEEERARLVETAQSQARLLEAIARFDAIQNPDYPGGIQASTLSQMRDAHEQYEGFGRTGEFTLARREGDQIVFLLRHRHGNAGLPEPIPFDSELAEPMRRALLGQSGTVVGLDYRGETVVAAYEPVAELDFGIVAKIDLSEILAPFAKAAAIAALAATVVITLGAVLFFRVTNPLLRHLAESEQRFRSTFEQAAVGIAHVAPDGRFLLVNERFCDIVGHPRYALLNRPFQEITPRADLDEDLESVRQLLAGKVASVSREKRHVRGDGSMVWVDLTMSAVHDPSGEPAYFVLVIEDIDRRKQIEEQLRYQADLLKNVSDAVIATDMEFKIKSWNRAAEKLYGWAADEVLGKPLAAVVRPEYPETTREATLREFNEMGRLEGEFIHHRRDGTPITVWGSVSMLRDAEGNPIGAISANRDISERKRAEEALRAEKEKAQRYVNIAASIILALDGTGTVTLLNESGARILECEPAQALGQNWFDSFLPERKREETWEIFSRLMAGDTESTKYVEQPVITAKGDERLIRWHNSVIRDESGRIVGTLSSGEDVTEKREAEQALHAYSERLEEMVAERTQALKETQAQLVRREKLAMLGQLAGGIGHELRNPLGIISNAVYYLDATLDDADEITKEYLRIIGTEVSNATKIVSDLLDFARTREPNREAVPVELLVSRVLDRRPPPDGIETRIHVPAELPPIYADAGQMTLVLDNLVLNAYQAMPDGGELDIRADREREQVRLSVADTGLGIAPEDQSKLFEPLFTTKARGIGLGLAIAKNLIEANAGAITVESEEGEGSTFTLFLPLKEGRE